MSSELFVRVRSNMSHGYLWELSTRDGHVIETSQAFGNRDACIADAERHGLPISGVRKPRRVASDGDILSTLPKTRIAQALRCLPDAQIVTLATMDALSEIASIGHVRITAKRTRTGGSDEDPEYAWVATKAILLE